MNAGKIWSVEGSKTKLERILVLARHKGPQRITDGGRTVVAMTGDAYLRLLERRAELECGN